MAQLLQGYFLDLQKYSGESSADGPNRAQLTVVDISRCLDDIRLNDIEFVCSLMFNKESGILAFLKKTASLERFKDSKENALICLGSFIERVGAPIITYAVSIKEVCLSVFIQDKHAKVQSAAIITIIKLLQSWKIEQVADEMKIPQLIERFFLLMTKPSQSSATVKQVIYQLLGVLTQKFPELTLKYSERLLQMFLGELKKQMTSKTKKPEFPVICGCLLGLDGYLHNFTCSAEENNKNSNDIFIYTFEVINFSDVKRYEMLKAGLLLLSHHAMQFSPFIYDKCDVLYRSLVNCSRHSNRGVSLAGYNALEAMLQVISNVLVEKAAGHKSNEVKNIFTFFIGEFKSMVISRFSPRNFSLAIKGYGLFAAPCKLYLNSKDLNCLLNEVIERSEHLYFSSNQMLEDKLEYLAGFLESLSDILNELEKITDSILNTVERLVLMMIGNFPHIQERKRFLTYRALAKVLVVFYKKGALFNKFLQKIVFLGVIQSCSHTLKSDKQDKEKIISTEQDPRDITYENFLDLWKSLLDIVKMKELNQLDIPLDVRETIAVMLYDELITSVLKILKKLDLSSDKTTDDSSLATEVECYNVDSVSNQQPRRPSDFLIFINLVEFCRDLFPHKHTNYFEKWVFHFGYEIILLSSRFPLISGFYKLLGMCLQICSKIKYFKGISTNLKAESMKIDNTELLQEQETSLLLFIKFLKEVLDHLHLYKDELLISCIQVVLHLPTEMVEQEIEAIIPAVQTAIRVGLSYLPLAVSVLNALERWERQLPSKFLVPYYPKILPYFKDYLNATLDEGNSYIPTEVMTMTVKSSLKRGTTTRKLPYKSMKIKPPIENDSTELEALRQRIVIYLGSLGSEVNSSLIQDFSEDIAKLAIAWDTKKHIKFSVPFMDMKPEIYFDLFLPRVVELACTSGNRQTKAAACEFLHSLIVLMLGIGAQRPDGIQQKYPMDKLFRKIFPSLLKLACDVEMVAKQLFEPLVLETIHWFSRSKAADSPETIAVLESLLDGIVNPNDATLRDLSAKCIKEFLMWSIKQSTPEEQKKNPFNTRALLKRMYSLGFHPNGFKRLGAALIFNSIYTIFREEESLVSAFTLEILVQFVESLSMAHNEEKAIGTEYQCKLALDHVARIIVTKADLFCKEDKLRRCPSCLKSPTLVDATTWLLEQCGRVQTECRHKCMELVYKFSACIKEFGSLSALIQQMLKTKGPTFFITRFEGGGYIQETEHGILKTPLLADCGSNLSLKKSLNWYESLLAALDCYMWLFREKLVIPTDVIKSKSNSKLFESLDHFLSIWAMSDISKAVTNKIGVFTPSETVKYNFAKCTVIVRIFDFLSSLMKNYPKESLLVIPKSFWNKDLWTLIARCILQPTTIGFKIGDIEVLEKLPKEMEELLVLLMKTLPQNSVNELLKTLTLYLTDNKVFEIFGNTSFHLQDSFNHLDSAYFILGIQLLKKLNLLQDVMKLSKHKLEMELSCKSSSIVFEGIVTQQEDKLTVSSLSPSLKKFAEELLKLSFLFDLKGENLLNLLANNSSVITTSGLPLMTHGAHFYTTFRQTIDDHIVNSADVMIPLIIENMKSNVHYFSEILNNVLQHIGERVDLRKGIGPRILDLYLQNLPKINEALGNLTEEEKQSLILQFLKNMIMINSKKVTDTTNANFPLVFDLYTQMLAGGESLAFKSQILDLLPFFLILEDRHTKELKNQLLKMSLKYFPLKSSEFAAGSPQYNEYINVFKKIMNALELSGSLMLLEFIISIICREEKHVYEEEIQASLIRFIKWLPRDRQVPALEVPFSIFMKEGSFSNQIRLLTLRKVCLTLIRHTSVSVITEFFKSHILEIMDILNAKQIKGPEDKFEMQLISKIGAFQLMELLFGSLPKNDLFSKESKIVEMFCKGKIDTGKELTQTITRVAHATKKENMQGEEVLLELRRQLHCAAYNTLIAVIGLTQIEEKFYTAFLFSENVLKGENLWDNLIDTHRVYEFEIELQSPLTRKKQFVAIRQDVLSKQGPQSAEEEDLEDPRLDFNYLSSQYLAASSLNEYISQFDFSVSEYIFSGKSQESTSGIHSKARLQEKERKNTESENSSYIEMDMDELNQHECMATLTALIQHLSKIQTQSTPHKGGMPSWMTALHSKLSNAENHQNIQLFIAKVIINNQKVFEPYASQWLSPLMQLIISGRCGKGINVFITDLLVVLLSWSSVAIPKKDTLESTEANDLLEFLMDNAFHERRDVLRNNLEIIKTLMECWKKVLEVPTRIIYNHLKGTDPTKKDNLLGIQLLGIVMVNDLPPYKDITGIDRTKYLQTLAMNLTFKYKEVYAAAAEVIGMVLQYLSIKEGIDNSEIHEIVFHQLKQLVEKKRDQFLTCLHKVQLYYPAITDRFINNLFFMLPGLHGYYLTLALETVQKRVEYIEDIYQKLKTNDQLLGYLLHRDERTQMASLQIISALLRKLKSHELLYFLPSVTNLATHSDVSCRKAVYEILMWTFDSYREDDADDSNELTRLSKETLLLGLADSDQALRLSVSNFWSHETKLPTSTLERALEIINLLYSPSIEQWFFSYGSFLLLEMTSKSPDYNRKIFEHPLSECIFNSYNVNVSWKTRYSSMTPLFVDSFSTLHSAGEGDHSDQAGQIRATQVGQQFSATQGPEAFNWLTQKNVDTMADYGSLESLSTTSSLLFTVKKSRIERFQKPKFRAVGANFGEDRLEGPKEEPVAREDSSSARDIFKLKRRFWKDNDKIQMMFARRQLMKQRHELELKQEMKLKKEAEVTMYRKYRTGDFPDIEINYSYVIAPLQALAQRDGIVGELLFSNLISSILEQQQQSMGSDISSTFQQLNTSLNRIIQDTKHFNPLVMRFVMEICFKFCQVLQLDVADLSTVCLASRQQNLGILLIENSLNHDIELEERKSKRARLDHLTISKELMPWVKLAELYKSLDNYDVVRGIFSSKIGSKKLTQLALESESRADYLSASKYYNEALSSIEGSEERPDQAEIDFWDTSLLQCYNWLTQWENLESHIMNEVTDSGSKNLDQIWEDSYYQEHYLPFLIRAKLKLEVEKSDEFLMKFVNNVLVDKNNPQRKAFLESRLTSELAELFILKNDYDRACHYTKGCLENFLTDWTMTSPLAVGHKKSKLLELQKLSEMHHFLQFIKDQENFHSFYPCSIHIKQWLLHLPGTSNPLSVWDDIIMNRKIYFNNFLNKLEQLGESEGTANTRSLIEMNMESELSYIEACNIQSNHTIALSLLKKIFKRSSSEEFLVRWKQAYVLAHQKKAEKLEGEKKFLVLFNAWEQLGKEDLMLILKQKPHLSCKQFKLHSSCLELMADTLQKHPNLLGKLPEDKSNTLANKLNCSIENEHKVCSSILELAFCNLQKAANNKEDSTVGNSAESLETAEGLLQLALFCNKILQTVREGRTRLQMSSLHQFPEIIIESILEACKLGSSTSRNYIPCLFRIIDDNPAVLSVFIDKSKEVPNWMFISWINQMVALLNKPQAKAVQGILLSISQDYPQALIYPLKLSKEGFKYDNTPQGKSNKCIVERLTDALDKGNLVENFILALDQLSNPSSLFNDFCSVSRRLLKKQSKTKSVLIEEFKNIKKQLYEIQPHFGKYRKQVVEKCKDSFKRCFGEDGTKLLKMSPKDLEKAKQELEPHLKVFRKPKERLKDFSDWLSDFHMLDTDYQLEIPGQYSGKQKPLPEYHVKIAGFEQEILCLASLRQPKKIVIRGSDEKEYSFLVKGGEDLRLDQRIEQLFDIMNEIFVNDVACGPRMLKIKTYQVIPLTSKLGLLEWVDNTQPLRDFIINAATENEKKLYFDKNQRDGLNPIQKHFFSWIMKAGAKMGEAPAKQYEKIYLKYHRTDALQMYNLLVSKIPSDLLRRAFMNLSTSLEAFITLRNHFVVSHAVLCVCHYILGIGDRHLSNFMVSLETGTMVGIDFGHAFGSATQFLPVPELLPFRLTSQILNLMNPLQDKGLLQATMVHVLSALRSNHSILLSTMDVFVQEPSLDWQEFAMKMMEKMSDEDTSDLTWYPKEKIEFVKRKLNGDHPSYIMNDELKLGHEQKKAFSNFQAVSLGDKTNNPRASFPPKGLSASEQVIALIDQATDANVLIRTWYGWEPWI